MNRIEIATQLLAGMLANPNCFKQYWNNDKLVPDALKFADELIKGNAEYENEMKWQRSLSLGVNIKSDVKPELL